MPSTFAIPSNSEDALRSQEWPRICLTIQLWPPSSVLPGVLALAALVASTWVSFRLGQSAAFTGFLYLVLVVLAALYGGFWQAIVPPILSFANRPANWAAIGDFEFTAL